MVNGHML